MPTFFTSLLVTTLELAGPVSCVDSGGFCEEKGGVLYIHRSRNIVTCTVDRRWDRWKLMTVTFDEDKDPERPQILPGDDALIVDVAECRQDVMEDCCTFFPLSFPRFNLII